MANATTPRPWYVQKYGSFYVIQDKPGFGRDVTNGDYFKEAGANAVLAAAAPALEKALTDLLEWAEQQESASDYRARELCQNARDALAEAMEPYE